ncbi:uncharacterized protein LOC141883262 [Acropora palmata]|uniref:uncharacterized protein LOC141883262 n=1 Tax=Acropora palmata TaxID=6131 RepID=UPI003DA014C1
MQLGAHIEFVAAACQNLENELEAIDKTHPLEAKPENPVKICLPSGPVDLQEQRKSLKEDICKQKRQLRISNIKLDAMNKALSQLLKKKDELQRRNCRDELLLAASKQNLLAFRDQRIKMASPLDTWTARSLPNLHVTHFPDAMQAKCREKAKNFLQ